MAGEYNILLYSCEGLSGSRPPVTPCCEIMLAAKLMMKSGAGPEACNTQALLMHVCTYVPTYYVINIIIVNTIRPLLIKFMFLVTRPRVILMAASIGHYW